MAILTTTGSAGGECPWCGFDLDPEIGQMDRIGNGDSLVCPRDAGGCGKRVRIGVTADVWLTKGEAG